MPRVALFDLGPSLKAVATRVAQEEGVRPDLVHAVMQQESGGDIRARSPVGAIGPMQLMPATAADLGVDPYDPEQNLRGGARYLKQQLDWFGGNVPQALAAYNAGPGAVQRAGGIPNFPETQNYVRRIEATLPPTLPPVASALPPAQPSTAPRRPSPTGSTRVPLTDLAVAPLGPTGTPAPPLLTAGEPPSLLQSLASGFDPRTPEGRRNWGGALGAIGTGAVMGAESGPPGMAVGAVTGGVRAALPVIAGAAVGGAVGEASNLALEDQPPSRPAEIASRLGGAGLEQAAYETGGQVVAWPVKALGRRLIASRVGKAAAEGLQGAREAITSQVNRVLTDASERLKALRASYGLDLAAAKGSARTRLAEARAAAAQRLADVRQMGQEALRSARGETTQQVADLETRYGGLPPPLRPAAEVGQAVHEVIQGPAKHTLDEAGQAVEEAAQTGPMVDWARVKDRLQTMASHAIPESLRPESEGLGYAKNLSAHVSPEEQQHLLTLLKDQLGSADHPLPGVLGKVMQAPDEIPFAEAHQFKRMLDDAVNWDRTAKKQAEGMTKGIRGAIRETMRGHEPYNMATAAYEALVPLFRRGLAPQIRRSIIDHPEYVVSAISLKQPTKLQLLKDLLLTHATTGGGGPEGQAAWDSLRSAWLHEKVIKGGLEGLADRVSKLTPEFRSILADDPAGQTVLRNLEALGTAYQQALESGAASESMVRSATGLGMEATRASNRAALQQAAHEAGQEAETVHLVYAGKLTQGRADVAAARQAKTALRPPTSTEAAFNASSLVRTRDPGHIATDLAVAAVRAPYSIWGNLALLRLLKGPRAADLVQWASFSTSRTQALVRAFTSPALGMAAGEVIRLPGFGSLFLDVPEEGRSLAEAAEAIGGQLPAALDHPPGPPRLVRTGELGPAPPDDTAGGGPPPGPPQLAPPAGFGPPPTGP